MNDGRKSDSDVVPAKPANKPEGRETAQTQAGAEPVEGRELAEGNTIGVTCAGRRAGQRVSQGLSRVREAAKDKEVKFTALLHHVSKENLEKAYREQSPKAAPGVDGQTWKSWGQELERNLQDLHARVHTGAYRVKPSRRVQIPKADGRQRPLGVASLEDKVVQKALVEVLNAIYEGDFYGFSYGYRPGRSQHQALDALAVGLKSKKVNWVLDADVEDFFGSLDHGKLMEYVERRIGDRRVLRLIQKWLKAGIVEEGEWKESVEGTPQGATISPLLANVYLHYVLDQWVERWRREQARGDVIIVRWADDFIVGFQYREDAERFRQELNVRMEENGLKLNAEKSRLIEFGRFAAENRERRGEGKPQTFDFLGFTRISGRSKKGSFFVKRITIRKRMRAKLKEVKNQLMSKMHLPIPVVGHWLNRVVQGHYNYYGVPGNSAAIGQFAAQVLRCWRVALMRRSHKARVKWERMYRLAQRWLPPPCLTHPFPEQRFHVRHPR